MLLLLLRNCFMLAKHATSFPCISTTSQRPLQQTLHYWCDRHYGQLQKMILCQQAFSLQKFNIKMLWTVYSKRCNGVWSCSMFLEIFFSPGSQLILSSCLASLSCNSMETGIGNDSFFHFCGHQSVELPL